MSFHTTDLVPRAVDWRVICTHLYLNDKITIKKRCESEVSNNTQKIINRVQEPAPLARRLELML